MWRAKMTVLFIQAQKMMLLLWNNNSVDGVTFLLLVPGELSDLNARVSQQAPC
jgi:hypothetical protein